MLGAMVSTGSDLGIQLLLSAAPKTPRVAGRIFPERALQTGDVIINEITGKYTGYYARMHAPVSVGKKPGPECTRLWNVALAALNAGLAILRPGLDTDELAEAVRCPVRDASLAGNADGQAGPGERAGREPMRGRATVGVRETIERQRLDCFHERTPSRLGR